MSTIIRFLEDTEWTLSILDDIDPRISGRRVEDFREDDSELHPFFTRVENLTLPITVLRCDYSKKSHAQYLFTIFHRLNMGGIPLNNQEIRNCIYHGRFNALLKKLDTDEKWMHINNMKENKSYRFIYVEMILRFFAYYDSYEKYTGRLAEFLNEYMAAHRNPNDAELQAKEGLFTKTTDFIDRILEEKHSQIGHSLLEALMFGVACNLAHLATVTQEKVRAYYQQLQAHPSLSSEILKSGISSKEKVFARLEAAKAIFSGTGHV